MWQITIGFAARLKGFLLEILDSILIPCGKKFLRPLTGKVFYVVEADEWARLAALGAAYHMMESGQANGILFRFAGQATSNRIHINERVF